MIRWVRSDPWMSKQLGRNAYVLAPTGAGGDQAGPDVLPAELREPGCFAQAKVSVQDVARCRWLEDQGFRLIDTNLVFDRDLADLRGASELDASFAEGADRPEVEEIAADSFRHSRFYLDPAIDDGLASRIKRDWAGNFFRGSRGDMMLVTRTEGRVSGFVLLLADRASRVATIDLIAVGTRYRRRGIARSLIIGAVGRLEGDFERIRVGTQAGNIPSVRCYETLGFRLVDAQYVFHRHGDETETREETSSA